MLGAVGGVGRDVAELGAEQRGGREVFASVADQHVAPGCAGRVRSDDHATGRARSESEPASMVSDTKRYVVRVGAYRVELGDDFEAAALRRIVEVLGSC